MNHYVIGTAGHVDHGKTHLIKALTGIDTDRLPQEKKRGITIEPGFAHLDFPDGKRAGIIDVPGHERFIRNMLAGAGSIDIALLVVAADEGVMPQTREHLGILSLLGIRRGVVAVTKSDLADGDWMAVQLSEIVREVRGTFLEGAPVLAVSAHTGEGIDELMHCLGALLEDAPPKMSHAPPRLPVDRVFSVAGFGTVVTGTLLEGSLSVGESLLVYPRESPAKIRGLQVHGQSVEKALCGQRVAVNLAGMKRAEIEKGDVLAGADSMECSSLLDVRLDILPDSQRTIAHNARLHFYHGTARYLCKLTLFSQDALAAGGRAYAQLRLDKGIAAKPGDRFVVRFYSPLETVGGGVILDPAPPQRRRKDKQAPEGFRVKDTGSLPERIERVVLEKSGGLPAVDTLKRRLFFDSPDFDRELQTLAAKGDVLLVGDLVIHRRYLERLGARGAQLLAAYHKQHPLTEGMLREELRSRLFAGQDPNIAEQLAGLLEQRGYWQSRGNSVALNGFAAAMSTEHRQVCERLLRLFLDAGLAPPSLSEVSALFAGDRKVFQQAVTALVADGSVVVLTPQIFFHREHYQTALACFREMARVQGNVTLAQYRDRLATSRKYAVAILEHFDKKGITKRIGDARVLMRTEC